MTTMEQGAPQAGEASLLVVVVSGFVVGASVVSDLHHYCLCHYRTFVDLIGSRCKSRWHNTNLYGH